MLTFVIMSANSSLSAAKRRRGGTQLNPPVPPNINGNELKPPGKMPHPLDILKNHELRIRELETIMNENKQKLADLEKTNVSFRTEILSLATQNVNILKQLKCIKKHIRDDGADSLTHTFSSVKIGTERKIEGSICEEDTGSDSSNED